MDNLKDLINNVFVDFENKSFGRRVEKITSVTMFDFSYQHNEFISVEIPVLHLDKLTNEFEENEIVRLLERVLCLKVLIYNDGSWKSIF
jgi:hypothetical protein